MQIFSAFVGTILGILWGELRYRHAEKKQKPVAISGLMIL